MNINYCKLISRCKHFYSAFNSTRSCMSTLPTPPFSTLFFGSDKFSLKHLDALKNNWTNGTSSDAVVKNLQVVITSDHSPVARYAKKNGLEVIHWKALTSSASLEYDMGIVVSFGHLIPRRMIELFPCGLLNVHPSALPRHRGATPIQHTILRGDRSTAVSIMKILPHKFDEGPVYKDEEVKVGEDEPFEELRDRLADIGSKLLLETLRDFPTLKPRDQQGQPTYAPKLSHVSSFIDWQQQTRQSIYRQHLALGSTYALTTKWKRSLLRFPDMVQPSLLQADDLPDAEPGAVKQLLPSLALVVRCKDGWVGFNTVIHQKKRLPAKYFFNGYLQKERDTVVFESMDNELKHL